MWNSFKEQIIDAALDLIFSRLVGNVVAVCDETQDPLERLRKLLVRHIEMIRENHAIPRIIFTEEVYDGSPRRKARIYEGVAIWHLFKEALVRNSNI